MFFFRGKAEKGQTGLIGSSDPTVTSHITFVRTQQIMMAQGSEEFMAVIAALNQGTAMQAETSIETQRPPGVSASHPALEP